MLLVQDPELLLVDEPVAGMTDAETEKPPPSCCARSRKSHSVVVVEHDMDFVRGLGCEGHGAARRLGAGRGLARAGAERPARHRSLSGALSHAAGRRHRPPLRRQPGAAARVAHRRRSARSPACSAATASARPARCAPSWARSAPVGRQDRLGRAGHHRLSPVERAPARHRAACRRAARSSRC